MPQPLSSSPLSSLKAHPISSISHYNPEANLLTNQTNTLNSYPYLSANRHSSSDIPLESCHGYEGLLNQESGVQKGVVTDRFIPSRKAFSAQLITTEEEWTGSNENAGPVGPEQCGYSLPDIFQKCIIHEPKKTIKIDNPIQHYQNKNIFKFVQNNQEETQFQEKVKQFDFTQQLVTSIKSKRKINKTPFKVLDAPALQDDFYLNLIDWGPQNFLAVGLASNVYLWNAENSKVTKLCDLGLTDTVTSVGWATKGQTFSLGTNNGQVHIWDIAKLKKTRVIHGHSNRISVLSWNSTLLSSGSRDKTILHRDVRCNGNYVAKLTGHKQQVCGLKWSPDQQQLCSGGNDNKLMVWSSRSTSPVLKFADHTAAVKAVAWSPHQHGLLASGGGTADRHIRFRNSLTGQTTKILDTGSQVCNLTFGQTMNQVVSTHGYSYNEINIWKYPKMEKVSTLMGHTMRVLYLTMSPDGSTIVTGAGDQTLRFWNVFPSANSRPKLPTMLNAGSVMLR